MTHPFVHIVFAVNIICLFLIYAPLSKVEHSMQVIKVLTLNYIKNWYNKLLIILMRFQWEISDFGNIHHVLFTYFELSKQNVN